MLDIYYSQTLLGCEKKIFNSLKTKRANNVKHVVFTPDRRTLQIEQKLFDELNESCLFDVDVTTFSRFTSKVLSEHNMQFKVLTKPLGVALIKKVLSENEKELKTFKRAIKFNGFSTTLFDTICMFKSCGVTPDDIKEKYNNKSLNAKLQDIKLVYSEYEKFLSSDWTDSFNKLNLLTKLINSETCANTHYYFVGFDEFTPQMYEIIAKLATFSNVSVATAVSFIDGSNNKNIYLNNVYLQLLSLAEVKGIKYNKIYCPLLLNEPFSYLSNNLFSYKKLQATSSNNAIKCYKFNNLTDEVNFAVKYIINMCLKGAHFSDFAVLVPSLSAYKEVLKKAFNNNGVNYFIDESEHVNNSIILRFYTDLFNLINNNCEKTELINYLLVFGNIEVGELTEFQNYVSINGINYKKLLLINNNKFKNISKKLKVLQSLLANLSEAKTFENVLTTLETFAKSFEFNELINKINLNHLENGEIIEHKQLLQVLKKVNEGWELLKNVLGNYEAATSNCFSIIKAYFENITVVIPPIISNSVFVGDVLQSYVSNKKYAIVLGCADGEMPQVRTDLGIISDNDIEALSGSINLTPTINMINKRNKFRIYETLLTFNNLLLSYVCLNKSGEAIMPSEIIKNMLEFFVSDVKLVNGSLIQQINQFETSDNNLLFNNPTLNFVKQNLLTGIKQRECEYDNPNYINSVSVLYNAVKNKQNIENLVNNHNFCNEMQPINNAAELFFANSALSVSQFEDYFNCPFKHFVDYGLSLKRSDSSEFTALTIGNILHEYVARIVPIIEEQLHAQNALHTANLKGATILENILEKEEFSYLKNNSLNAHTIKGLKSEIMRINECLIAISQPSKFKPQPNLLEMKFSNNDVLKLGAVNFSLVGVIDRVDVCENELRVIDYKTGNSDFSDFTDVYCGKKLQLIVYAFVAGKKLNAKPVGAFYLPLKNSFIKQNKTDIFKLRGVIENNLATIVNMDNNLISPNVKSQILNLRTATDGGIKGGILLEKGEMQTLINHAINLMNAALIEMNAGNIQPHPLKISNSTPCEYCNYFGMCKFDEHLKNSYREVKKIKSIKEMLGENG